MARILVFGDSNISDELYFGFDCWVTKLRKFFHRKEETSVFNLGIVGDTSKGHQKIFETVKNFLIKNKIIDPAGVALSD